MNSTFDLLTSEEKENFEKIEFDYNGNEVKLSLLFWQPRFSAVRFQYQKDGYDTWIVSGSKKKEIQVKGKDFVTVFCDDLKVLLNFPKCRMRYLDVSFVASKELVEEEVEDNYKTRHRNTIGARIFEVFEAGLKSREQKLQTEMIILFSSGRSQTLPILHTDRHIYVIDSGFSISFLRVTQDELKQEVNWFFRRFDELKSMRKNDVSGKEKCLEVFENPLIMKRILEYVQFFRIQALRKVSSGIRNCVDTVKPDPQIENVFISIEDIEAISIFMYRTRNNNRIRYVQDKEVCHVGNKTSLLGVNFRSIFFKDLEMNLRDQKACLKVFSLDVWCVHYFIMLDMENGILLANLSLLEETTAQFLKLFKEVLKSRSEQLRVERLQIKIVNQNHVMEVLPYIHSLSINVIKLRYAYETDGWLYVPPINIESCNKPLEIDEVSKLDQWRQAKEFNIKGFSISTPIPQMNITHFSNGEVLVQSISSEDLAFLKEGFLKSSSLVKFKISFEKCFVDETIYDLIGYPYRMANRHLRNQRSIWYFQIPNTNMFLHILYYVSIFVAFSRVESTSVPSDLFDRN